jgi:hypothetical protein
LACATASAVEVEATPAFGGLDRGLHHGCALRVVEIGELAGRAERRQAVHARCDEIVAQPAQYVGADAAFGIDR